MAIFSLFIVFCFSLLFPLQVEGQIKFSFSLQQLSAFSGSYDLFYETELDEKVDALPVKTVLVPTNAALLRSLQDLGYKGKSVDSEGKMKAMVIAYWNLHEENILNLTHVFSYHVIGRDLTIQQFQAAGNVSTDRGVISWNPSTQSINDGERTLPNPKFVPGDSSNLKIVGGFIRGIDRVLFPAKINKTAAASVLGSIQPSDETEVDGKPEASTEPGEESSCFPSNALVHLSDGKQLHMRHLEEGMRIRVSQHTYSPVFLFSHKNHRVKSKFIRLTTKSAHSITLTPSHYLYANGKLTAAKSVRLGDFLHTLDSGQSRVVNIESVSDYGFVAPHSLHSSDLFVNGVLASSFTTAVHPWVAHLLLSPVRALVHAGLSNNPFGRLLYNGGDKFARLLPSGPSSFSQ